MRVPSIVGAIGAIVLAVALGCGPKIETVANGGAIPPCSNLWPSGEPADTVRIAVFDQVNPAHAPVWRNDAERLVFHHLYEMLPSELEWPCTTPPRLVEERPPQRTTSAAFTIRPDARFWDGTAVTARDIVSSVGAMDEAFADLDSVVVRADGRIEVTMHSVDWAWLESPTRAVTRRSGALWPYGTGPYLVDGNETLDDGMIVLRPTAGRGPVIQFVDARGVDPRDLLDPMSKSRCDVIPVNDRSTIEYAVSTGMYNHLPLGQTRAYVLISVDRALAIERGESLTTLGALQSSLARDAVRSAYAHSIPEREWTRAVGRCRMWPHAAKPDASQSRRIVYDAGDPTARDLADRIASLALTEPTVSGALPGIGDAGGVVSTGLDRTSFALSLIHGSDLAYVVAIRYDLPDICRAVYDLVAAAPWLIGNNSVLAAKVLPLVKTSSVALVSKPPAGYGFEIVVDHYFRAMIIDTGMRPQP